MRAFEAICCVPRHVLPWYSVCSKNGSPKTLCTTATTKTVCLHLGVIMFVHNDTCWRSNIVHTRFQHAIFSERYCATGIYRLCLSTVMDTNEFFVRRNVWMEFWSFMGNKRRTIPYSLVEGKGERSIGRWWVIEVFSGRKLMGPDSKWPLDFDYPSAGEILILYRPFSFSRVHCLEWTFSRKRKTYIIFLELFKFV